MMLSILIPCYNEKDTIEKIITQVNATILSCKKEIIIVDDASTDGTSELLKAIQKKYDFKLLRHDKNLGKGAGLKTALHEAKGDIILIQDADLEYNPADYSELIKPILEKNYNIVYGSRFINKHPWKGYWINYYYNKILSYFIRNVTGLPITDVLTCYKVFRTDLIKEIVLHENRFVIELELACQIVAKNKDQFIEIPISYTPRTYKEGKKIGISDAFDMLRFLALYKFKRA